MKKVTDKDVFTSPKHVKRIMTLKNRFNRLQQNFWRSNVCGKAQQLSVAVATEDQLCEYLNVSQIRQLILSDASFRL